MRFTLSSSLLNSQLQTLSKVINSKNSLPILDCILFEVGDGQLTLTASDKENVMTIVLALDACEGAGAFALPKTTVIDAVKELPEQPLTFDVKEDTLALTITYQNGMYQFVAQNAEEFPKAKSLSDDAATLAMDVTMLADNLTRSLFATAQDAQRPVKNGIYFEVKSEAPASFILPSKPAALLKLMTGKAEGEAGVSFDSNNACFTIANATLTCRLIEGRYPNYNSVIPQDNPNKLTVDRKALIGALRRVLPFASESTQSVRLHIDGSKLIVSSEDVDFAKTAKEAVTCEYEGRTMDIGFKCPSLIEILSNMDSDEVTIALADPSRAGVIEPSVQPDNAEVLMLIMPMLLND